MRDSEHQDGPDGLHRLHKMLSDAYGVAIPSSDYWAVIVLLDNLGVCSRCIEELMRRFTRNLRSKIVKDVNAVLTQDRTIDERDISRVGLVLTAHGYDDFANAPSSQWAAGARELDPQDPNIPTLLRQRWRSLVRAFPTGLHDPKHYVSVVAVLIDEQHSPMEVEILLSQLTDRPNELISKDIEALGSVLFVSEEEKIRVKSRLDRDQ